MYIQKSRKLRRVDAAFVPEATLAPARDRRTEFQ
jgi:hypothetical protein